MKNQETYSAPGAATSDWVRYIDLSIKYLGIIWGSKWMIAKVTGGISLLFAVYLYFSPSSYVSTSTLLPDIQGLQNLQKRGAIGELAAAAGLTMGLTPSQLFPEIIRSERILSQIMKQKFGLESGKEAMTVAEIWGLTENDTSAQYENTLKRLRRVIDISLDRRTMIVTLQVTTENPQLSSQLANSIVSVLDTFSLEFRKKLAGEQRTWIENRLIEIQRDLAQSEEALKQFRERNRSVLNSPQLLLEQARFTREVEINSTVFIELKKQLEIATIEEAKNTSIVLVLDPARPPYLKSGPARRWVFATFFGIILVLNIVYVIVLHGVRQNPEFARRWESFRSGMKFRKRDQ
jgi:uncharacterized protein involved in exopolysaccharide biosynthesis